MFDESKIKVKNLPCKLCGSDNYTVFLRADNIRRGTKRFFNSVECKECGFKYTNPAPVEDITYYYENYEESSLPKSLDNFYYQLFRRIPYIKGGKILDVGCGEGKFLEFLSKNYEGMELYGSDMYDVPLEIRQKYKIFKGELHSIKAEDNFFDIITMWGSIEHMIDPLQSLQKAYRLLKKGGTLIVWTINIDSFEAKIFKRYWYHLLLPEHYSQFSDKTLKVMVEKAGFKVKRIRYDMVTLGFINSMQCYLQSKKINVNISNWITKALSLPLDFTQALCKKSGMICLYAKK